jgi:hypothetical protein
VSVRFRERVSSPCGEDGELEPAGHPPGGGGCAALFPSSRCMDFVTLCVFYYCRTYYKAVRVGEGGEWRTCAMRDDEPRPVWMSLPITHKFCVLCTAVCPQGPETCFKEMTTAMEEKNEMK